MFFHTSENKPVEKAKKKMPFNHKIHKGEGHFFPKVMHILG